MWPWTSFPSSHKNLLKVLNDLMLQIKSNKLQKIENIKEMIERGNLTWAYLAAQQRPSPLAPLSVILHLLPVGRRACARRALAPVRPPPASADTEEAPGAATRQPRTPSLSFRAFPLLCSLSRPDQNASESAAVHRRGHSHSLAPSPSQASPPHHLHPLHRVTWR